ncbi:hypothetical protein BH10ACI2_BH10ACI2_10190 [soil metagenome]
MKNFHTCTADSKCSRKLHLRLDPPPVDERAMYVHSVCSVLIDSRFGPGRSQMLLANFRERPELESALLCDLTVEGPVPSYTVLPDSEMARRYASAIIHNELRRLGLKLSETSPRKFPSPPPGRGSPPVVKRCVAHGDGPSP